MANKIDYGKLFKYVMDAYEGKKPKGKDFYHKVYLCYGMLCQVQDLQEFCLFIKENTNLEYQSEKRQVEKPVYNKELKKYENKIVSQNYYYNVSLKFKDGFSSVAEIKKICRRTYPQEMEEENNG